MLFVRNHETLRKSNDMNFILGCGLPRRRLPNLCKVFLCVHYKETIKSNTHISSTELSTILGRRFGQYTFLIFLRFCKCLKYD